MKKKSVSAIDPNLFDIQFYKIHDKLEEFFKYKWEFLRRNEKYIKDFYDRYPKTVMIAKDIKNRKYFYKNFGILVPLNPGYTLNQLVLSPDRERFRLAIDGLGYGVLIPEKDTDQEFLPVFEHSIYKTKISLYDHNIRKYVLVDRSKNNKIKIYDINKVPFDCIQVAINLKLSKDEIRSSLLEVVFRYKDIYDKVNHINPREHRDQYAKYDAYLNIYDLVEAQKREPLRKRLSFEKIAALVYPEEEELDSSTQKTKRNYYAAVALVNGGYKKIS